MDRVHQRAEPGRDSKDCRCACGSLVARMVREGVELKCRRCKRTLIVPLASPAGAPPTPNPRERTVPPSGTEISAVGEVG